jgi:hypothetical protein
MRSSSRYLCFLHISGGIWRDNHLLIRGKNTSCSILIKNMALQEVQRGGSSFLRKLWIARDTTTWKIQGELWRAKALRREFSSGKGLTSKRWSSPCIFQAVVSLSVKLSYYCTYTGRDRCSALTNWGYWARVQVLSINGPINHNFMYIWWSDAELETVKCTWRTLLFQVRINSP